MLDKAEISEYNKTLIKEFIEEIHLQVKLSLPRRTKLIWTLKELAVKLKKDFDKPTNKDIQRLIAGIQDNEAYSAWTISDYLKITKRFYKWLIPKKGLELEVSWIRGRLKEKDMPRLKRSEMLTEEEARLMIECAGGTRNKAILSVLWDAGCRIGELGSMTIGSVHFEDQGTVVDFVGKTGKRSAFLIECTPYLQNWLNAHPMKNNPSAPLWISRNQDPKYRDKPLGYRMLSQVLEETAKEAGLKKKFNPHLFRHSRALWCVQNGWNNVEANKMFGWGMSSNMYNYYVTLGTEDLAEKMKSCYGLPSKKDKGIDERKPKTCPRCDALNDKSFRCCFKCGFILDIESARKVMKMKEMEDKLHNEVFSRNLGQVKPQTEEELKDTLFNVIKEDPKLLDKLRGILS